MTSRYPQPIEGGLRVCESEHFYIDVLRMAYGNIRIVETYKDGTSYRRGWCYQRPLPEVVLHCFTFEPEQDQEPAGWVKEVGTDRRACGFYYRSPGTHQAYDPKCPDCGNEDLS